MPQTFAEKLVTAQEARGNIILLIVPRLPKLPLPIQRYDDPFLPFGREIIRATSDLVCGYMFDLAAYLALGAAGVIALERTLPYTELDSVRIFHGPFAGAGYAPAAFDGNFNFDAVTLADDSHYSAYTAQEWQGAFVVRHDEPSPTPYGVYWTDAHRLTWPGVHPLHVAGESVLYADRSENFAEGVRAAVEKLR
jgi:hypothetical protein